MNYKVILIALILIQLTFYVLYFPKMDQIIDE